MMKKIFIFTLLVCSYKPVFPQTNEIIYLLDSLTRQPISYANIIYADSLSGTYTNNEGAFTKPKCGLVSISCVGYYSKQVISNFNYDTIFLIPQVYNLKEIVVHPKNYKEEIVGYANKKSEFSLGCPSGREVAILLENKKNQENLIEKVILKVDTRKIIRKTTNINFISVFKINFYCVENETNIGECIGSIILKSDKLTSNNSFDVSKLNLLLPKDGIFVGIEWVGKENPENNELYIVTENLLEPFVSTTFKENSIVYERKKFKSDKWHLIDGTNIFSIVNNKNKGFTPLISIVINT